MKKYIYLVMGIVVVCSSGFLQASEMEKGSQKAMMEKSKGAAHMDGGVKEVLKRYIIRQSMQLGAMVVKDESNNQKRKLLFKKFREGVQEKDGISTMCAVFQDIETGEIVDVDIDAAKVEGKLQVVNTRIHKVTEDTGEHKGSMTEGHKGSHMDHEHGHKGSH